MEAICPICGVKFKKIYSNKHYCSLKCYKKSFNKTYSKEYYKKNKETDKYKEYQRKRKKTDKYKESQKEYQKEYQKTEKRKEYQKEYHKKSTIELKDSYIKQILGMPVVPKELVEAKREQLKLFRLIKQMS